jgi:hypothetical protein
MHAKRLIIEFTKVFVVAQLAAAGVIFLWNLISHAESTVGRESAFRFAIIFCTLLTWVRSRDKNNIGVFKSLELQKGWKVEIFHTISCSMELFHINTVFSSINDKLHNYRPPPDK